jgi:hypothetical protein
MAQPAGVTYLLFSRDLSRPQASAQGAFGGNFEHVES